MIRSVINWLRRQFPTEEINGAGRCPTYLYRNHLLSCRWFKVYFHRFVADDWSLDLHDHPKRFVSIGLRGRYRETTPKGDRVFRAPWIRSFPAEHLHRISLVSRECWTLVIVFAASRKWGFVHSGKWIGWREYVNSDTATEMKSCNP
jgi:hypothetical protein